ncbi:2-amino-4-hydroxy-6-hydroxymethyldihydropteridine diphosphokinase [Leadbettera azotonutricia]|uniref:2-amino-4-hydroxy-6-hydroxymethyldihydropteridine pyrophosphokinase n=1 Tax=Leadbettera azotonutricia (strain ATCC BAA-888 / DSM 13862 / ZAS-9) TaxID=545695 RepID=F5YC59_LEAAZ|nr:2-amino-4-hydroxy-6-hydroxymethyldihydropteridine diphosphokinase [Leadbettera azotonutricia]AEF83401.1 2-amino-4-hydroxy-6-hydroxymethyldihydropteridine diphosphokinase [Leadbettera azotonutricia ZAS-9]
MPLVVLGLGSNQGDSLRILEKAVEVLGIILGSLRQASIYETVPLHVTDQPKFFNTAVAGEYSKEPWALLSEIHKVEASFGRDRSKERRWGERTLDIDILLFGDQIIANHPLLEVPHPRLKERRFALEPLLELCPDAIDPASGIQYSGICRALPEQGIRRISGV